MCGSPEPPGADEEPSTPALADETGGRGWTRRQLLTGLAAGAAVGAGAGAALIVPRLRGQQAVSVPSAFGSTPASRLAMHLHGSWSEGRGSWEGHFHEAAAAGIDVIYLTDHDHRATAHNYLTSLVGAAWDTANHGAASTRTLAPAPDGSLRLVLESSTSATATGTLRIQPDPCMATRLRTSISGLLIDHTFGASSLTGSATYEIQIDLSFHPAAGSRKAGRYSLIYRFGNGRPSRFTEGGGLVGVVAAPMPAAGTRVRLVPQEDVAAFWPTMWAPDNSLYGLSFTVVSPAKGARADIAVRACTFERRRSSAESVTADQAVMLNQYAPRYPGVSARASTEIGRHDSHLNPFGVPQMFPDYALDTPTDHDAFYTDVVADVHAVGGVVSYNHALGSTATPLLTPDEQSARRRETYSWLAERNVYDCDILEVGYTARGNCDTATHLALWDTLSRNGFFLTGNGANDDHSGKNWQTMSNGFFTGVWSASTSDADVVAALRSGQAFFAHLGKWANASLDMRLDDSVPMGAAVQSSASTHRLSIQAANLPRGAVVEVIKGPADFGDAVDPGTSVARRLGPSDFVGGVSTITLAPTSSRFFRVQVKDSSGAIVGGGNPIWILRSAPPRGVPHARGA